MPAEKKHILLGYILYICIFVTCLIKKHRGVMCTIYKKEVIDEI